jgi:hypothetical protein
MKKILYLLILCLLTINLFACKKKEDIIIEKGKKEYNSYTSTVISEEDYENLISNFSTKLTETTYGFERMEQEDYEIFMISLCLYGDVVMEIWVYVFKPQNLKYFQMKQNTHSGNDDDYFIYIPDGEGAWELPIYMNETGNCYFTILGDNNYMELLVTLIQEWLQ